MSYFLKSGATFRVATKESMDLHEKLPAGNYVVKMDPMENFYLEHIEDFTSPSKMYGDTVRHTQRIIDTFWQRDKSTGVALVGEKGSGKTLLSKNISIELAKVGVPTIVINTPWHGDKFNTLIQSIEQPCIVLFDEFEKVYDREQQEHMLTLLDGIYSSKKLFVLTCNDKWRVDSHMQNRPGRIFYLLTFKGLEANFIREYCNDNLNNKTHIETIVNVSSIFASFNFDMMKAMVEEMNRYDESPQKSLEMLNVKPEFDGGIQYNVEIYKNDRKAYRTSPSVWTGTPLACDEEHFSFWLKGKDKSPQQVSMTDAVDEIFDEDESKWYEENFSANDMVKFDTKAGQFIFEKDGTTMILSKVQTRSFNWDAF